MNLDNFYGNIPPIRDLIENYDAHRQLLHARLAQYPPQPVSRLNIGAVYGLILSTPPRESDLDDELPHLRFLSLKRPVAVPSFEETKPEPRLEFQETVSEPQATVPEPEETVPEPQDSSPALQTTAAQAQEEVAQEEGDAHTRPSLRMKRPKLRISFRDLRKATRGLVLKQLANSGYFGDQRFFDATVDFLELRRRLKRVSGLREHHRHLLKDRLEANYQNSFNPLFRCNFWLDIARIERLRGNELIAATYELRVLRLLGDDRIGLSPRVGATLIKHGFMREAKAAEAMFGDPDLAEERVYTLLLTAFDRLRKYEAKPLEILDDRRSGDPKVTVVVSLYKAADKLAYFLTALAQQTLVREGKVEFVLVDSGSPTSERQVLKAFLQHTPLNVVYARSQARETIQAAWNRGIALARAPYLVFLGADETLYPETLEVLARELDRNPGVDWVMTNSLVTAVDDKGLYQRDIMPYDRTGAGKDHVYLETCYLSWVGGMYRKSIHDRFGYYDEDFGAAGDTEFKNRILPHINVKFVDSGLGLFLNYPEGQTTLSPRAEIEDLRAWYMHRTPGGVRYAFENRPVEDAEALLCQTLGYRKSFCRHISSDIEYGSYLSRYIRTRKPNSAVAASVDAGLCGHAGKIART